jgi:hypothetical protein
MQGSGTFRRPVALADRFAVATGLRDHSRLSLLTMRSNCAR